MARERTASPTRADQIIGRIRADILNGRLVPGSRLGFVDLGRQYEVSTGVLREVLPRLVEQGLASTESQQGFRVIEVSVDRLTQLTDARVELDTLITRRAIERGDIAWEADVVAKHHAMARIGASGASADIPVAWLDAHEDFHVSILTGCANSYLVESAVRLRDISQVYRCWSAPAADRARRDVDREHREIMEAVISRDADLAARLTETHIRNTTDLLLAGRPEVTTS